MWVAYSEFYCYGGPYEPDKQVAHKQLCRKKPQGSIAIFLDSVMTVASYLLRSNTNMTITETTKKSSDA